MEPDLITKIRNSLAKKEQMSEECIRSLMILIRKLLDSSSFKSHQNSFLILRLFCNWSAHTEISSSNTGLRILSKINDTLINEKDNKDLAEVQNKISSTIGISELRKELKGFLDRIRIDNALVSNNKVWVNFIDNLIEIIRDVPLLFPSLSQLDDAKRKIYTQISTNPIKPGMWVISMKISLLRLPGQENEKMCLSIGTEDTTTIIIPLLIDLKL